MTLRKMQKNPKIRGMVIPAAEYKLIQNSVAVICAPANLANLRTIDKPAILNYSDNTSDNKSLLTEESTCMLCSAVAYGLYSC